MSSFLPAIATSATKGTATAGMARRGDLRRSIVMLAPGAPLTREDAVRLIEDLAVAEERSVPLVTKLRRLLDQPEGD